MKIAGLRLCLRDLIPTDLYAHQYWMQPGHRWQELDGPYYPTPPPPTDEELEIEKNKLEKQIRENSFPEPRRFLVIADGNSDEYLGRVTWYWISHETNWPAIGIVIFDPDHWGNGLGYEALGLWIDYLFQAEPLFVRLDLRTWSGNESMMKLAGKLGFAQEARFRNARIVDGKLYDGMGYGLLREEWIELHPDGFYGHLQEWLKQK